MKAILKELAFNINGIEIGEFNYNNSGTLCPLISELGVHSPDLAALVFQATNNSNRRNDTDFRKKIQNELIALLPLVSEMPGFETFFLHRSLNHFDWGWLQNLQIDQVFKIENHFMAFYLNGLSAGGVRGGCGVQLICESIEDVKCLGHLSQVPTEGEVFISDDKSYQLKGNFEVLSDFLHSGLIKKDRTREYFERIQRNHFDHRRYIYIELANVQNE